MTNAKVQMMTIVALVAATLGGSQAWAGPTYTGMLASDYNSGNSQGADGLIQGNNGWMIQENPLVVRWVVSFDGSVWHYEYLFNENSLVQGAVSHMILEVSSTLEASDILNASHLFEDGDPQWYLASDPGNPDMPNVIWGLKFDTGGVEDLVVSFDSSLAPVWGDIYMKDGTQGGAAWNAGFTLPDLDPLSAPANGSINSHILLPDSVPTIPTPGAVVLSAAGCLLVAWLRRRGALV